MNTVLTVVEIVAPVFLLGALGFGWIKLGFEYRIQFVTRLAMTVAVPSLIFVSLATTDIDPDALTDLLLSTLVAYALIALALAALVRLCRIERRSYLAPLIFGNTGNLGLPLALFAFGETGLGYAIVVFATMAILSFTIGIWLVAGEGSFDRVIREPLVGATLLGGLFLFQDWSLPTFAIHTLELIGQMAIPLMLITLGVAVARLSTQGILFACLLSLAKLCICSLIGWGVGHYFPLDPIAFGVLLLQLATPVAVTSYMLAEKYGADAEAVAGLVVVSTVLSVAALPVLLALVI